MKRSILAAPTALLLCFLLCLGRADTLAFSATVPAWVLARGGLPFDCTGCGDCCKVEGDVWLSPSEATAMAAALHLSPAAFTDAHCDVAVAGSGWRRLISVAPSAAGGGGCTFLTIQGGCGVYATRPQQCVAYPFWPRVLASPAAWDREVGACEGIGRVAGGAATAAVADITGLASGDGRDTARPTAVVATVPLAEIESQAERYAAWLRRFPKDAAADVGETAQWAKHNLVDTLSLHSARAAARLAAPGALRYEHCSDVVDYKGLLAAVTRATAHLLARSSNAAWPGSLNTSTQMVALVVCPQLRDFSAFREMLAELELQWRAPLRSGLQLGNDDEEASAALLRDTAETPAVLSGGEQAVKVEQSGGGGASNLVALVGFHPRWVGDDGAKALKEKRSPVAMVSLVLDLESRV
jgi:hypothetical protein